MQYRKGTVMSNSRPSLTLVFLSLLALVSSGANIPAAAIQHMATQPAEPHKAASSANRQSNTPVTQVRKRPSKKREPTPQKTSSAPDKEIPHSPQELAMSLLEGVLASVNRITPVEYRILTEVEAATLLWQRDQARALAILNSASETLRELKEQDSDKSINSKQRRLRFLAFLKIARLNPDLVKELALNKSDGDKAEQAMSGDWTDEARAVMTVADEQIESDPARAAQLAQQSFSLGQVDWVRFLQKLSARDNNLSERLAMTVMDQLRSSSITPIYLLNLRRFTLRPDRSPQLKDYFFQSLAIRLRRNVGLDMALSEISTHLVTAQEALQLSANYPRWQDEFRQIIPTLEELLKAHSAPAPPPSQTIRISMTPDIKTTDAEKIAEEMQRVERIRESKARDQKYSEMAINAAFNADIRLAEDLMSKIEDETIRRGATLSVYGPYARKAFMESDLTRAKEYASSITDSFGRTLALDLIAQELSRSGKDKKSVREIYNFTAWRLRRESPAEDVAKAFLLVANSLSSIDTEESLDALNWAIYILNQVTKNGELLKDLQIGGELALWVRVPAFSRHDEVADLTVMIGSAFKEMAKRDANNAQSIALGFVHQGLFSFAQLGIVRGILEKVDNSRRAIKGQSTDGKKQH